MLHTGRSIMEWKGYILSADSDCCRVATLLGLLVFEDRPVINCHVCKHAFSYQRRVRMTHDCRMKHLAGTGASQQPVSMGAHLCVVGHLLCRRCWPLTLAGSHVRLAVGMCRCLNRATTLWSAYFEVHAAVLCEIFGKMPPRLLMQATRVYPDTGNKAEAH